jgi:hypothetical protein
MHDWLSWNRARWDLGRQLLTWGIKPQQIEGGLEWDGCYSQVPRHPYPVPVHGLTLPSFHASFPEITGDYALSFSPLPDSRVVAKQSYELWLPRTRRDFYLLRYGPANSP